MRNYGSHDLHMGLGNPMEVIRTLTHFFNYRNLEDLLNDNPVIASLIQLTNQAKEETPTRWELSGSVGLHKDGRHTGENRKADVQKVIDRLYHLEILSTRDYYFENLYIEEELGIIPNHKIPATIAAIQIFQKYCFKSFDGLVETEGNTTTYEKLRRTNTVEEMAEIRQNYQSFHQMIRRNIQGD